MAFYLRLVTALWTSFLVSATAATNTETCRYLPGDAKWPSSQEWSQLNTTVNGRLIATKLLAQPCHGSSFNASGCTIVKDGWTWPTMHWEDPSSVMNPYWLNDSCSPFTATSAPCTLGNIVDYAINITCPQDAAAGLQFAQNSNIRLVIKNTGHDFLGRSTGKGALGLWTHNLKDISVFDYNSTKYTGRAMRMGAGVQAFEAYKAADTHGVRIVGGSCPTVGLSGGYTQGAGHGPLNGAYGLAADNVLEWEVVTADGQHLTATPKANSDLYWALSGGGGGTYAVVLSMTVKAHPDGQVGGGTILFNSTGLSADTFWNAIEKYHEQLPALISEPGWHSVHTITNSSFFLDFVTWPDHTAEEVQASLKPFRDYLESNQIPVEEQYTDDTGYYQHYARFTPDLPDGAYQISELIGGRIVPLSTMVNNNAALTGTLRNITQSDGWVLNGVNSNLTYARVGIEPGANSVLPAWRDSVTFFNLVVPWDPAAPVAQGVASENEMTYVMVPQLERITPGSGTYINEGDFNNPNWKEDYFGANYPTLLAIKKKYDPNDLFYAIASVGNDAWTVASDGRVCRAQSGDSYLL